MTFPPPALYLAGVGETVMRPFPEPTEETAYFFFLAVLRFDFFAVFFAAFLALLAMLPS